MRREPAIYLAKIDEMCGYLLERAKNRSEADYLSDLDLRLAVERAFILIGEAMSLLKRHFPLIGVQLEDHVAAIGFRNLLVHRYWDVDNREVWSILTDSVEPLKNAAEQLLAQLQPPA